MESISPPAGVAETIGAVLRAIGCSDGEWTVELTAKDGHLIRTRRHHGPLGNDELERLAHLAATSSAVNLAGLEVACIDDGFHGICHLCPEVSHDGSASFGCWAMLGASAEVVAAHWLLHKLADHTTASSS